MLLHRGALFNFNKALPARLLPAYLRPGTVIIPLASLMCNVSYLKAGTNTSTLHRNSTDNEDQKLKRPKSHYLYVAWRHYPTKLDDWPKLLKCCLLIGYNNSVWDWSVVLSFFAVIGGMHCAVIGRWHQFLIRVWWDRSGSTSCNLNMLHSTKNTTLKNHPTFSPIVKAAAVPVATTHTPITNSRPGITNISLTIIEMEIFALEPNISDPLKW